MNRKKRWLSKRVRQLAAKPPISKRGGARAVRTLVAPLAAALVVNIIAGSAHAADPTAESLFTTAVTALDAGDFATACPLFEQSYARSPALGTAYNLALCADHAGKKVDALKQFRAVQAKALAAGRKKTEADAREHADALERTLGHVRVHIPPGEHAQIAIDGKAPTDTGDEIVEPGDHPVVVIRDGGSAFRAIVTVRAGEAKDVDVPAQSSGSPPTASSPPTPVEPGPSSASPWPAVGVGVAVVGLVGIGIGAGFGIAAQSNRDRTFTICGGTKTIDPCLGDVATAKSAWGDGKTDAAISTASFITGAVLLVGGVVIYLAAPKGVHGTAGFAIEPRRVQLGGSF